MAHKKPGRAAHRLRRGKCPCVLLVFGLFQKKEIEFSSPLLLLMAVES